MIIEKLYGEGVLVQAFAVKNRAITRYRANKLMLGKDGFVRFGEGLLQIPCLADCANLGKVGTEP